MEGLRQETLNLSGALHELLVLVGEFVHTHDGDDVHQLLVALENSLHFLGNGVMLLADLFGREYAAGGFQRIDSRINAL